MNRIAALLLLLWPSVASAATRVVVPVATAKYKDRVYSTTVAFKNMSSVPVTCNMQHTPVNRRDPLVSRVDVQARQTLVLEDFLKAVGAIGSASIDCEGDVLVAARIQDSFDEGKSFRAGHVYAGLTADRTITAEAPQTITTQSDVALVDVSGTHSALHVRVRDNAGALVGVRTYDMPPRALQIVNVEELIGRGDLRVEVTVDGPGRIAYERATDDAVLAGMAVRMPDASRPAAEAHFDRQERLRAHAEAAALQGSASIGGSVIAPLASFKAAPFQEPMTGLILMRRRWYDPRTGTFLTPDPMGYHDSPNLYSYTKGDPVNNSDPTGELIKLTGHDPWGDLFWIRRGLSNPAAANMLTVQGDEKKGYWLGLAPGRTIKDFIAAGLPDPKGYRQQMIARGFPMSRDQRMIEEKIADMITSMQIVEFRSDQKNVSMFGAWPFKGPFSQPTTIWGGGVTIEPHESLTGNTQVYIDPTAIIGGSAHMAEMAFNIAYDDPGLVTMHEFGHALAYVDRNRPCFQMWSVFLENQVRARRGETTFRLSEGLLNKQPKTLICEPGQ
ncbi:MAG: RHS repeat-associated core domain-containing protein [Acidobacteria bacterium]|nr:RHS repeat-associated core domain-containing protein [Acidobacteriota bacterium]MBV9070954.1 RHS repeat-associated core domain-containing protein [Acidobacteriota bacterium]MBV9187048.1 RHS repeat-associated core domain-containing protein [Acidobacteriota bacterium]